MSRIGKQPIPLPEKTTFTSAANGRITVTGPLGSLSRDLDGPVDMAEHDGVVELAPRNSSVFARALSGTYAAHIRNMISGVNTPFVKKLVLEGVGFKSAVSGKEITFSLGFSHPVVFAIPDGLTVTAEKNVITVSGINKEDVGAFAARMRARKKPEPYKGKGMRYEKEVVRRKEGKKSS